LIIWPNISIAAHPHMLRHATGYALANTDTRTLQEPVAMTL
jgi:hypothetical protein